MDNWNDQRRCEAPRHEELNVMLLANLTRSERGKFQFLGCENHRIEKPGILSDLFLQKLIKEFLESPKPSANK